MKFCPNCNASLDDNAAFCTSCGTPLNSQEPNSNPAPAPAPAPGPNPGPGPAPYPPYAPVPDPTDHTAEFSPKDISENKVLAMTPYIFGVIGIIIAMLASNKSPYVDFQIKQYMKLWVLTGIVYIATAVLFWTLIVPIAGSIFSIILFVVRIIGFVYVCKGSAKELPIIKGINFLK